MRGPDVVDRRAQPGTVGECVVLPFEACAAVLALIRGAGPVPVGVARPAPAPEALSFLRQIEAGAMVAARRRALLRATATAGSAAVARAPAPASLSAGRGGAWQVEKELTVDEAAELAGVSVSRLRMLAAGGRLSARRISAPPRPGMAHRPRWAVDRVAVEDYARRRREGDDQ